MVYLSLESCFHFARFRVLIKYVLVFLQLITLKINAIVFFTTAGLLRPITFAFSALCATLSHLLESREPFVSRCFCLLVPLCRACSCASGRWVVCTNPELQTD